MIDYRMDTFLALCDRMNYRQVAEALSMTQPAVTQHIQFLEGEYGCRLFDYSGRQLKQTDAGKQLERYARSARSNEAAIRQALIPRARRTVRMGATKSIGDYVLGAQLIQLVKREDVLVSLEVNNTKNLLHALDHQLLDIALIEGYFDKSAYEHHLMGMERLVGICASTSPLAGQTVSIESLFGETLILREAGSGTRAVFEGGLHERNYTLEAFAKTASISSLEAIKTLVRARCGVSFVYQSVADSSPDLATFSLSGVDLCHEFNYVYLRDTTGASLIALIEGEV